LEILKIFFPRRISKPLKIIRTRLKAFYLLTSKNISYVGITTSLLTENHKHIPIKSPYQRKKIIKKFYPEHESQLDDHRISKGNLSLFKEGHFICKHNDGRNEGRICVILVYLNEEEEYSNNGGELVIENNHSEEFEIKPIFGKFCIMDFTKNNIPHSVNEVKNDFNRLTYINFITLPKEKNNLI